jgi:hypothetical protein
MLSTADVPPSAYVEGADRKQQGKPDEHASSEAFSIKPSSSTQSGADGDHVDNSESGQFSRVLAAHDARSVSEEDAVRFVGDAFKRTFGSRAPLLDLHARTLAGLSKWAARTSAAKALRDLLLKLYHQTHRIAAVAHLFDFPNQPGNGYWTICKSFVR